MYQSYKMDLAGRPLVVDINRVGKQANGCAFMHYGDTTVLCTVEYWIRLMAARRLLR